MLNSNNKANAVSSESKSRRGESASPPSTGAGTSFSPVALRFDETKVVAAPLDLISHDVANPLLTMLQIAKQTV